LGPPLLEWHILARNELHVTDVRGRVQGGHRNGEWGRVVRPAAAARFERSGGDRRPVPAARAAPSAERRAAERTQGPKPIRPPPTQNKSKQGSLTLDLARPAHHQLNVNEMTTVALKPAKAGYNPSPLTSHTEFGGPIGELLGGSDPRRAGAASSHGERPTDLGSRVRRGAVRQLVCSVLRVLALVRVHG